MSSTCLANKLREQIDSIIQQRQDLRRSEKHSVETATEIWNKAWRLYYKISFRKTEIDETVYQKLNKDILGEIVLLRPFVGLIPPPEV